MILDRKRCRRISGTLAFAALIALAGCHGARGRTRSTQAEPSLSGNISDDVVIGDAPVVAAGPTAEPGKTVTYVDRHPLFSKPREYWDSSGDNKVVKAAAATFIGVPVGFVGEMKQIVVGAPPSANY